jgi:outer membrane lipoprotein SlyB
MRPIYVLIAAFALFGCQPNISSDTYSVGSVGQVNRVIRAKVLSARTVNISGTQSGVGAGAGAVAGGVGGSAMGNNARSGIVGAVGGAVVGGIIGAVAEEAASQQKGIEYVVETENGALMTIVQGVDPVLSEGQRVLVVYGQKSRIIADNTAR